MTTTKKSRKWLKGILIALSVIILIPLIGMILLNERLPEGNEGSEADALARKMMTAINQEAWDETGVISWRFAGIHEYLWDRDRDYARVSWGENEVLINLRNQRGLSYHKGEQVEGEAGDKLLQTAWSYYCNDSFWLNPISKLFDPGTSRRLVDLGKGEKGLLITYSSGGVTPGDSYLWMVDESGLARKWKMWVNIIPIGGVGTSWEGWQTLATGARVATQHKGTFGFSLNLSNIQAGSSLSAFVDDIDPFAGLDEL